jgi:Trp operon repressor
LEVIKEAIDDLRPDIVVIDGIRDLLADFNDVKESSRIINELMIITTTYNCGIITVIHTNKADNNARGHLGSELYNKAETVLQVANKDGTASVKPHHSRNIEIEPFSFRVVDGLPTLCDYVPCQELNDKRATMLQELFSVILSKVGWMEREKLTSTIVAMKKKDKRTAQRYISDGLKAGIIKINRANNIVLSIKEEVEEDDDDMLF